MPVHALTSYLYTNKVPTFSKKFNRLNQLISIDFYDNTFYSLLSLQSANNEQHGRDLKLKLLTIG
jgi:hypothetical protein